MESALARRCTAFEMRQKALLWVLQVVKVAKKQGFLSQRDKKARIFATKLCRRL
jgi:hypothetical protein